MAAVTFDVDKGIKPRIIRSTVRGKDPIETIGYLVPINHQSACSHASPVSGSMNVNGFTHKPTRTRTVRLFRVVLACALILGVQPLQAAATNEAWTNFLAGGPQTWATTPAPAFTPAIESRIWQVLNTDTAAQALSNPMIEYLEWRRNLDPTRFTSYHPNLSPALAQLLSSPSLPSSSASLPSNPPQPSSLLLTAAMTGWGIWWRHQLARQSSR